MDLKEHKCDLPPSLPVGNYAEVGHCLCSIRISLGADVETTVRDLFYREYSRIPLTSAEYLCISQWQQQGAWTFSIPEYMMLLLLCRNIWSCSLT